MINFLEKLLNEIKDLLEIRAIIALVVTLTFIILSIKGVISPDNVMLVVTLVLGFFFSNKATKDSNNKE